ncbi:MAG: ABC transporter ATP-binding protein [Nitrospinota bacterium]
MSAAPLLRLMGITKRFPGVLANDRIDFEVAQGEIHALLGENGAGKTTLMNVLYGLLRPEEGRIFLKGREVAIRSPRDALALGIGFVHQHFVLVPTLKVVENVALGLRSGRWGLLGLDAVAEDIRRLAERFRLWTDPNAYVWQLSIGEQQRVEILKALYRKADILILDEPTSVLTPQESRELFGILRAMTVKGLTIIFITHKLEEVMASSDRVTVLRAGRVVGTVPTNRTSKDELVRMMLGREFSFDFEKPASVAGRTLLEVEGVSALGENDLPALKGVSLTVHAGEVVGVAGVAGNGQSELADVIVGARPVTGGRVWIAGQDVTNLPIGRNARKRIAYIPEQAARQGLFPNLSLAESVILKSHASSPYSRAFCLNSRVIQSRTEQLIREFDVRCPGPRAPVKLLSGGNQQRLLLSRELSQDASVIVAAQPTKGLDVAAMEAVHRRLIEERRRGRAVLLISTELEEILRLSDRIAIMFEGEVRGVLDGEGADPNEVGMLMGGSGPGSAIRQSESGAQG